MATKLKVAAAQKPAGSMMGCDDQHEQDTGSGVSANFLPALLWSISLFLWIICQTLCSVPVTVVSGQITCQVSCPLSHITFQAAWSPDVLKHWSHKPPDLSKAKLPDKPFTWLHVPNAHLHAQQFPPPPSSLPLPSLPSSSPPLPLFTNSNRSHTEESDLPFLNYCEEQRINWW